MIVKELINKLKQFPEDLPVTINDCMDFSECVGDTIEVTKQHYCCYPFTEYDKFDYVNLEIKDKEYWN